MSSKIPAKTFSSHLGALIDIPNLVDVQVRSYEWFLGEGIKKLLQEISPIKDYTGKNLELHFTGHSIDTPKYSEEEAVAKFLSYVAPLRLKTKLINKKRNQVKEQEIYFGDVPIMSPRATFIINGVERTIVSQIIRSAGAYFTASLWQGHKLFGAKIIPNQGSWLEFLTEPDGLIGVKIDKKRRVPVTQLLRVFGILDDEFQKLFSDVNKGKIDYIKATLKKDSSKTQDESFIEIYQRIRPNDLATIENAKNLFATMFFSLERYDISPVGRFKLNQRLGLKGDSKLLTGDDIAAVVRELIRLNNDLAAEPDDIDHLGNRRIRAVGELVYNRFRLGLLRMRRVVQDKMSTLDIESEILPSHIVNARPALSVIEEFFASSQLSQFMDQVNPLAELEHKRRVSAMGPGGLTRERAGFEVRDVHRSHYGRFCPIQTPEGQNIGLVTHLATFGQVNELGFIETPYRVVKNGKVTNETLWLNALDEEKYKIAHASVALDKNYKIVDAEVQVRYKGEPITVSRDEVELIDVASNQTISVATSLIPFLEHDDANRALMGSNMQRQAVIPVRVEYPLVGTGMEDVVAQNSGYLIRAPEEGMVEKVDARRVALKTKSGTKEYKLLNFQRTNQYTTFSQKPIVKKGQKVKKGEILVDGPATKDGVLGLGQNLLVAFLPWEGANFEDAVILSERVVHDDIFTSIHIEDYSVDVRDTKLGPEITTPDIPNISEAKLRNLDEEGIVRIGAEVGAGDILVGKISPKGEAELTSEERLLKAIFGEKASEVKDTSLTLPHGKRGRIVGIKILSREKGDKLEPGVIKRITVEVAQVRKVRAGDKLAGRHGNKGVISQIRPVEDMPFLEDGTPVDIILNPLGVASRMNIGQVLETHLGFAAKILGYRAVTPALSGATEEQIKAELKRAGLPESGQIMLHDGRVGRPFPKPVTVGIIYMMKLNHLVEDKIHMRSIGPYSLITQQPLGGKAQFGGQRFGEMEVWALEAYGAAHTLQEMLTIKSDDVLGRAASYEAIIKNEPIRKPNIPATFSVLVNELKALGLNVELLKLQETKEEEFERQKPVPRKGSKNK